MRAFNLLRADPHYRRDAFDAGLRAAGYSVAGIPRCAPTAKDILVIWNRYGRYAEHARAFEAVGASVLVIENGLLGREWNGQYWYSLALGMPASTGGNIREGGSERWQSWGVPLCTWRKTGKEVIVLAQRGIGPPQKAQPAGWHERVAQELARAGYRVRVRAHPGERAAVPIEQDLNDARCTVSWSSGAAIKGLLLGVPTFYGLPEWIGAPAGTRLSNENVAQPLYPDREAAFERIAWSTWNTAEITTGEPIARLLASPSTTSRDTAAAH